VLFPDPTLLDRKPSVLSYFLSLAGKKKRRMLGVSQKGHRRKSSRFLCTRRFPKEEHARGETCSLRGGRGLYNKKEEGESGGKLKDGGDGFGYAFTLLAHSTYQKSPGSKSGSVILKKRSGKAHRQRKRIGN